MLSLISMFLCGISGCAYWYFQWQEQRQRARLLMQMEEDRQRLLILEREVEFTRELAFAAASEPAELPQLNLDAKRKITKGETEWKN